ncbi:MAG TPA: signal peptidase I [Arthrobacter sp.]
MKVVQPAVAALAGFYLSTLFCLALWALAPLLLGWQPTVVMSGSMEPTVNAGDILVASTVSPEEIQAGAIKPGMVLLAVNPLDKGTLFTHRVVNILPDGRIITKGDNNGSLDPEPLPTASIRGIEKLRIPGIGMPIQAFHAGDLLPLAAFVVVTTIAAVIVVDDEKRTAAAKSAEDALENDVEEDTGGDSETVTGPVPKTLPPTDRLSRRPTWPVRPRRRLPAPQVYATRKEARRARQRERGSIAMAIARTTTIAALGVAMLVGGSTAQFTATTAPPRSSWAASASFGGSNVATCNGAKYTVSITAATITCTIVSPGTGSVTHDLTIQGTGANAKWTVTADWSGVTKFKNATLTNYGYTGTSGIPGPTYLLTPLNLCTGSPQPDVATSTCNFTWIGSGLAARTPRFIIYLNP